MTQIKHPVLERIAQEHYQAIKKYIVNRSTYNISMVEQWVQNCFGNEWNFQKLILAKPHELELLANQYKSKCCNVFGYFETLYSYLNQSDKFTDQDDKPYQAYELIVKLGVTVCPYCNRNTIYNLRYTKRRTSELDHFYPQSKYPFLAISFYNLIPSCKVCNKIKLDNDDKEYINPYDMRFDPNKNMKFSFKLKDATFYHSVDGFKIDYKFNQKISADEKNRIENNLNDFELKDLYQNHKDTILELIQKARIYNDSYIDELFKNYEGTLFKNREDLLRLITCGYINDEDIDKRPLSKLIKDISQELGLI
ncbi:MAG: hypothetical protein KU38_06155 [Sulfurovum sp. FS08-3]|nr:MAG: hypothetical protein KU38_06155 [Sulfurovum sp. FS08-3]